MLVEVSRRLCAFAFYVIRTCLLRVSAVYGLFIFLFFVRFICFLRSVFFFFFSLDKISPMLLLRLLSYYVLFHGLGVCLSHSLDSLSLSLSSLFFLVLAIDSGLMSPLLNRLPSFTVHRENFIFLVACRHEVIHVRTVRAINNHYTRVYYR